MSANCENVPAKKHPPCGKRCHDHDCQVELCLQATKSFHAIRLIQLGARASLVCQVTGLEKTVIHRLYRQLRGYPSPSGQLPFTDTWYRENDLRMLQATLIWNLYQRFLKTKRSHARTLIDVYESYAELVDQPLLDLSRTVFVPQMITMQLWHERVCRCCGTVFLESIVGRRWTCPGCRLYHRYRCVQCGTRLEFKPTGRRRKLCHHCRDTRKHPTTANRFPEPSLPPVETSCE